MQTWRVIPDETDERRGRLVGPLVDAPCALGRSGTRLEDEKQEGDGCTPLGNYSFRRAFYRPDKYDTPICKLSVTPLSPEMGWCDDPERPEYNKLVRLPYGGTHEKMWRDDELYDLVLVIGHNDNPAMPGKGSAIFVHVAKEGCPPTEGCVALEASALLAMLRGLTPKDTLQIG